MRTVAELRRMLERFPDDALVAMKSDEEGNETKWWETTAMGFMNKGPWGWRRIEDDDEEGVAVITLWPGYDEPFDE